MDFLHVIIYINCFFIILSVLFTIEKSIIDIFSEQYGNHRPDSSQVFLNRVIFVLVFIYFVFSYVHLTNRMNS
ncbi:MAG: hypothetical protein Q2306_00070 [Phytoplasma sp.]|uniref:hypothetical protein n=1 Tax=Phytoplasma sp. TaxID=2155 RepID=UPI002B40E5C2|nr:hypothetical protein [Phytoplasma sp.]WRH06750.1 MAG: hypothetical protein Q2306_00070 [Phytoplasma sp.]